MSTLNVSNISDGTTSVGTEYVVNGSAKAWVNFNGTGTIASRDSFNVASLTDQGTGAYDVNFTNSMDNSDFVTLGYSNSNAATNNFNGTAMFALGTSYSPMSGATTSGTSIGSWVSGYTDAALNYVSVQGDLA